MCIRDRSGVISNTLGSAARNQSSQVAINIAEAGINYYLWHMSHNSGDYKDGTTAAPVSYTHLTLPTSDLV